MKGSGQGAKEGIKGPRAPNLQGKGKNDWAAQKKTNPRIASQLKKKKARKEKDLTKKVLIKPTLEAPSTTPYSPWSWREGKNRGETNAKQFPTTKTEKKESANEEGGLGK